MCAIGEFARHRLTTPTPRPRYCARGPRRVPSGTSFHPSPNRVWVPSSASRQEAVGTGCRRRDPSPALRVAGGRPSCSVVGRTRPRASVARAASSPSTKDRTGLRSTSRRAQPVHDDRVACCTRGGAPAQESESGQRDRAEPTTDEGSRSASGANRIVQIARMIDATLRSQSGEPSNTRVSTLSGAVTR